MGFSMLFSETSVSLRKPQMSGTQFCFVTSFRSSHSPSSEKVLTGRVCRVILCAYEHHD